MNVLGKLITMADYKVIETQFYVVVNADVMTNLMGADLQQIPARGFIAPAGRGGTVLAEYSDGSGGLLSEFSPSAPLYLFKEAPTTVMPIDDYDIPDVTNNVASTNYFNIPVNMKDASTLLNNVTTIKNSQTALIRKARRMLLEWEKQFGLKLLKTWRDFQMNSWIKKIIGRSLGQALCALWSRVLHFGSKRRYGTIYTTSRRLIGLPPVTPNQYFGSPAISRYNVGQYKSTCRISPRGPHALHKREHYHRWLIREALRRKTNRRIKAVKHWKYTAPRTTYPRPGERIRRRGPLSKRLAEIWQRRIPSIPKKRVVIRRDKYGIPRATRLSRPELWAFRNKGFQYWIDNIIGPALDESAMFIAAEAKQATLDYGKAQLRGTALQDLHKWIRLAKRKRKPANTGKAVRVENH